MAFRPYKIWSFDNQIGDTATNPWNVRVSGVAKFSEDDYPNTVGNEILCNILARAILLPAPPGFIAERNGFPCYVSCNFNLVGEELPPIDPHALIAEQLDIATGIIVFDFWIMNIDRHEENIHYDLDTKRVEVFDHGHCFMADGGIQGLRAQVANWSYASHCLVENIDSCTHFGKWCDRISKVPDFVIEDAVAQAVSLDYPEEHEAEYVSILRSRRDNMVDLIKANKDKFPNVDWDIEWGNENE